MHGFASVRWMSRVCCYCCLLCLYLTRKHMHHLRCTAVTIMQLESVVFPVELLLEQLKSPATFFRPISSKNLPNLSHPLHKSERTATLRRERLYDGNHGISSKFCCSIDASPFGICGNNTERSLANIADEDYSSDRIISVSSTSPFILSSSKKRKISRWKSWGVFNVLLLSWFFTAHRMW